MKEILANFLFQYKYCPLPGIGHLIIEQSPAVIHPAGQKIAGPGQQIAFKQEPLSADQLIDFIAADRSIAFADAEQELQTFAASVDALNSPEEIYIDGAGSFSKTADGEIAFTPDEIKITYATVDAIRIIRQNNSHQLLVGDTETTNTVMNEYYMEQPEPLRRRWWIAALVLLVLGAITIAIYLNGSGRNGTFGKAGLVEPDNAAPTYKSSN